MAKRTALILYGSETGNAHDVAGEVAHLLERHHFDTVILDMDSVQLKDLLKVTLVVFSISTQGQGEMPQNSRKFWKALLSSALKLGAFKRVKFTSFGLGDSSYARYNVAHRMLSSRLLQLGAKLFCARGEGNEQHPEGYTAGLSEWIAILNQALCDEHPLPEGLSIQTSDSFFEPKWKLDLAPVTNTSQVRQDDSKVPLSIDLPSSRPVPVRNSYLATVKKSRRITATNHFQDTRLLDLILNETCHYEPGALAVIYPKNFPSDIQDLAELMGWRDVVDRPLTLHCSDADSLSFAYPPLRHLDLTQTRLTLRWLLENVLDFMSVPRRSFFANLLRLVGEDDEDERYQKERLRELANPELIDELWDYTTRPRRTIYEVMMDFTKVKIPWHGGHLRQDHQGRTRVQLLIAIADPPSPIIKYRRRYGVCTRYVATIQNGQAITLGMQTGYLDASREDLDTPLTMIGPGTGLAPMRSLIWQRVAWSHESSRQHSHGALKDDLLIFGCRGEAADFYFRDEWHALTQQEGLRTLVAFSRDKNKPREYVQDQIRANSSTVFRNLVAMKGKVYICGAAGNMPKGVHEALIDVLMEQGPMNRIQAESYLEDMEKHGRYKQETW